MRIRAKSNFGELVKDGLEHRALTPGKEYFVLDVSDRYFRIVNASGEPILYPKTLFDVTDPVIPSDWQFCEYEDGEYFLEPTALGRPGFYEDWFGSDGDRQAQDAARKLLREELIRMANAADAADAAVINDGLSRLL